MDADFVPEEICSQRLPISCTAAHDASEMYFESS